MPEPVLVTSADLDIPANRASPIGARLALASQDGRRWSADFDWRQKTGETWSIEIETDGGSQFLLAFGGKRLEVDGKLVAENKSEEYERIYERFDEMLKTGTSEVDDTPLRLVADAFLTGRRHTVEEFLD
jgi:D-galactose 1-dehydrogenase